MLKRSKTCQVCLYEWLIFQDLFPEACVWRVIQPHFTEWRLHADELSLVQAGKGCEFQFKINICDHKWNPELQIKTRPFLGFTKAKITGQIFTFCLVTVKKNHSVQDSLKLILSPEWDNRIYEQVYYIWENAC